MKSTILVTGGTGFIGSHLISRLIEEQHSVILLLRKSSDTSHVKKYFPKLILHTIEDGIEQVFKLHTINTIIHLSSNYIKHESNAEEISEMTQANITLPSSLAYLATQHGVKNFINTGTFFEYKPTNLKVTEESEREAYNYYTATKIAFEELLKYYSSKYAMHAATLRLFSPYGEHEKNKIIALLIRAFTTDTPLSITEGTQQLSFTYVGDIVESYVRTLSFLESSNYHHYESFNIGSDKAYSLKQIVEKLEEITEKKNLVKFGELPMKNEIMISQCDISKAKELLAWSPMIDIDEGLKRTYLAQQESVV